MIVAKPTPLVMYEVTDPHELAKAKIQHEQFDKNLEWLEPRIPQIYAQNRGKCIVVAGQELFVSEDPLDAVAQAKKAHPEDHGILLRYVPKVKMERIYVHQGALVGK
jgi:hypothetical protein